MDANACGNVSVYGSILEAIGSVYSGYLNKGVQKYNAKVADASARLSDAQVGLINVNANIRNLNAKKEMRQVEGVQVASYAKSGVKFTGSPIDVVMQSRSNLELDYALNNINDSITAAGYTAQAGMQRAEGLMYKAKGYEALSSGYASATKSLISAGIQKYGMQSKGILGNETIGGVGGNTMQTKQFGKVWSPY